MSPGSLTHWSILGKGKDFDSNVDRFVADIIYMCVLEHPTFVPAIPKPRKVSGKDPLTPDLLPTKKLRGST